ncbi:MULTISPECIES: ABC transporter substrate-binding protein [Dickeya]|nr:MULTISPECIES: ABC transporter substrate-binding protein [Dickeya]
MLTLALFGGPAAQAQADKPTEIRIGLPDQSAGSKPFIGGPLGLAYIRHTLEPLFEAQGVTVRWQFFKGAGPAVNEALANRQLDIAYLGDLAAIIGRAGGLPTRVLLGSRGSSSYLAVTPESGIARIDDLRGKRVAVYKGTADQLAFERVLKSAGINVRDIQVVNLDWTAGKAALAARRIDAVWGGVSLLALRAQGIRIITSSRDLGWANTTQAVVLATQDFIDRYPQITQQLVSALVSEASWASDPAHLPEYIQLMAGQSQIPAALFEEQFRPDSLSIQTSPRIDAFLRTSLQDSLQRAHEAGLIRSDFSVDDWQDSRFVEQALTTLAPPAHWPLYDASGHPQP